MANTQEAIHQATHREEATLMEGSVSEMLIGIGAVVLAIIALIGFLPYTLVSITTIALGVAFAFEGSAISREISEILTGTRIHTSTLRYVMTVEFLAGIAGVALGILALVHVVPMVLLPAAAIVFGGGLIAGTGMTSRLSKISLESQVEDDTILQLSREAIASATYVRLFIGIGAMALGILALVGINPLVLSVVALLSVAFSQLISGGTLSGRVASLFSR